MMKLARLAALVAAGLLACAPAAGQRLNAFPPAGAVSPTDTVIGQQPSLCQAASCNGVQISLAQLRAFTLLGNAASASKLVTPTTINGVAFDGSATAYTLPAVDTATPRVPTALTISTAAPLAGGGALTGNLALSIGAASGTVAGTMSAADKSKLDGIAAGATANTGTVTTVSATGANGIGVTVTNAGTTPAIAITGTALTPSTLAATGAVTGSNLSGTNTGDQTIALTGDVTGSGTGSFATTLATSGVTAGTYGASGTLSVPIVTFDAKGRGTAASAYTLGSAAGATIGTSGGTVGLLNGSNTYSGAMTFSQLITGSVSGNAGTTTKLTTARKLNGVAFDGTADITLPAVDTATPRAALSGAPFTGNVSTTGGFSATGNAFNGATASGGVTLEAGATTGAAYLSSVTRPGGSLLPLQLYAASVQLMTTTTVSGLASCNTAARGMRSIVTDAMGPTFLGALSGGGSVVAPAFCNGSAWVAG